MNNSDKADLKHSAKDSMAGDLDYKDAKIKVSMFLDGDLLTAIKNDAKSTNQKYQTLINKYYEKYS